jgi:hypothetical protein
VVQYRASRPSARCGWGRSTGPRAVQRLFPVTPSRWPGLSSVPENGVPGLSLNVSGYFSQLFFCEPDFSQPAHVPHNRRRYVIIVAIELFGLRKFSDKVSGVDVLEAALGDIFLSLWNLCKAQKNFINRTISSSGILSYCSSKTTHKEDNINFKADALVVLMS